MKNKFWRIGEAALILLFTFQSIRVLFAMLFARVYDAVFDGEGIPALIIAAILTIAMLLFPLLTPRNPQRIASSLRISAVLCALARVPLSIDQPSVRLFSAIATLAFANLYLAGLLRSRASSLIPALSIALFGDQFLRSLGNTFDPSLHPWWGIVQLLISFGLIVLSERLAHQQDLPSASDQAGLSGGIAYGAALFLLSSLFALPNAAARWTHTNYPLMVASLLLLSTLPLWPLITRWSLQGPPAQSFWIRLLLSLLALFGLAIAHREEGILAALALVEAIAAFWLLLPRSLLSGADHPALGLTIGMTLFLLLGVAHAFSFTYAYTLSSFRGAGLPTFLVALVLALGPSFLARPQQVLPPSSYPYPKLWLGLAIGGWLTASLFAFPWGPSLKPTVDSIRLGTYNIHYGFDAHWHLTLEKEARTIEASGADVIALQEVDTGRLTSFGIDQALWLSRRLGMQVIYLPTIEHLTGIALLSRLEISESGGTLLPSQEEQTGIVRATVNAGGVPLRTYGVWLGLSPEERARQIKAALQFIGQGRASLAGDLNSTPGSPTYATIQAHGFIDPFIAGGFEPAPTDPAEHPKKRIDYVWIRGLQVVDAQVLDSLASDHRMVVVEAH
ncbi:MAG: endonuclease/exonuclease/phosphatase family protein [Anaerolineae bacterium]|nr:endonuclease/exonuclease/phosphatase family protein [Anaerolineae bacterium]